MSLKNMPFIPKHQLIKTASGWRETGVTSPFSDYWTHQHKMWIFHSCSQGLRQHYGSWDSVRLLQHKTIFPLVTSTIEPAPPEYERLVSLCLKVKPCWFCLCLSPVSPVAELEPCGTCTGSTPCTWWAVCLCSPVAVGPRGSALSPALPLWTCHGAHLEQEEE